MRDVILIQMYFNHFVRQLSIHNLSLFSKVFPYCVITDKAYPNNEALEKAGSLTL